MKTVVIVGAGFGGLQCARRLVNRPVRVVLLDRNNYHLFTPLLYQVASSLLNPSDIAYPVRSVFRDTRNVRFRLAEVVGVDVERRVVRTAAGPDEPYDVLVLATGADINFPGDGALATTAYHLTSLPRALELRNHVLRCLEAAAADPTAGRRPWLTFVVVGAGPTGVEYAGALAELVRLVAGKDYPSVTRDDVRIVLVEAGPEVLPPFPATLGMHARRRLERLGVEVRVGTLVRAVEDGVITTDAGESIEARTLVWAAGVKPNTAPAGSVPTRPSGRIAVDACLRVAGLADVFAIGDVAGCLERDKELPMLSAPAMQQGRHVAGNVLRAVAGRPLTPFAYRDKGIMATVGRHAGVARLRRVSLRGFPGWLAWLAVHLYFIIGFRNRVAVLLRWAWNYLFYDRPIRFVFRAAHREEVDP